MLVLRLTIVFFVTSYKPAWKTLKFQKKLFMRCCFDSPGNNVFSCLTTITSVSSNLSAVHCTNIAPETTCYKLHSMQLLHALVVWHHCRVRAHFSRVAKTFLAVTGRARISVIVFFDAGVIQTNSQYVISTTDYDLLLSICDFTALLFFLRKNILSRR